MKLETSFPVSAPPPFIGTEGVRKVMVRNKTGGMR